MWANRYWPARYWADRYWPPGGDETPAVTPRRSDGGFTSIRPYVRLPRYLDRTKAEQRIVKKLAKKIVSPEPTLVVEQLVARMEGVLLSIDPGGSALARSAAAKYEYTRDELNRIKAYWAAVERLVLEAIEEEEDYLLLLN